MSALPHMHFVPKGTDTKAAWRRGVTGVSPRRQVGVVPNGCWLWRQQAASGVPGMTPGAAAISSIHHGKRTDAPGTARFVSPNANEATAPAEMPGSAQPARRGAFFHPSSQHHYD